jgi:hypothetical protein
MPKKKGKVFLLSSESCGQGDSDLGFEILSGLLRAFPNRRDMPEAIIFWNTAVNLLAEGSPMIQPLRRLEEVGVKLLAGRLCVHELELDDKIRIGEIANLNEILDLIMNNDVVSL